MLLKKSVRNNPNIGLFMLCTDKYCVVPEYVGEWVEETFRVDVVRTRISGTSLVGVFSAGNSEWIVVPYLISEEEKRTLEEVANVLVLHDRVTALGNLIAMNDRGVVVSEEVSERNVRILEKETGLGVEVMNVGGVEVTGTCIAATNRGFLIHPGARDEEIEVVEEVLGVKGKRGTVNKGDPFVKAGLVANKNAVVVGEETTPIEIMTIQEVFG